MDLLKLFYDNIQMRQTVQEYFTETLKEVAINNLFEGKEAMDVKGAKVVLDKAFANLRDMYEPKQEVNIINQSR